MKHSLKFITALLLAPLASLTAAESSKPNIIFVLFDDLGYEPYPVLFDRATPWKTKEPLLKPTKGKGGGEDEDASKPSGEDSSKPGKRNKKNAK